MFVYRNADVSSYAMSDALASVYDFQLTSNHLPTRSITKAPYVAIGPNKEQVIILNLFHTHNTQYNYSLSFIVFVCYG